VAETYDVAGRLAQGRSAVETVSRYVWASHQVGYQHPDLTLHPGQLSDWYGTEEGLDLLALQRDCDAFDAAARIVDDALAGQLRQVTALADAWQGAGALASEEFLRRQSTAAAEVAAAVRTTADALRQVRDDVWRAVDTKVDAVVGIEGAVAGTRSQWLTAAQTVVSGLGDRAAASELVDTAVKPFVDNTIRTEWLAAMRAATATVAGAYQQAAARIAAAGRIGFEIPEVLGPVAPRPAAPPFRRDDAVTDVAEGARPVAATVPSAWEAPAAAPPAPAPAPAPAGQAPAPAWPGASPLPSPAMPGGAPMPDVGGGLPGLGSGFADTLGGLLGGGGGGPGLDTAEWEPPDLSDDLDESDEPDEEEEDLEDEEEEPDKEEEPEQEDPEGGEGPAEADPAEEPVTDEAPVDAAVPAEPPPAPTPPPPPAEPIAAAPPPAEQETPCEIAADEVPQVGPAPVSEPGGG
jgi:uncharacterized protein YukE